ncbi:three-Cys-motif partner protein TcmP [Cupriavidus pauculus]|nr:three-Cys-motif partner protein TcmP [Cupriavidus pauculus]
MLDQHSAVKHSIVHGYIRRYIKTVMAPATIPRLTLTLVDGFSGGGSYLDEARSGVVDGTPLIMLRAVLEARAELNVDRVVPREIDAEFFFIDKNPQVVEHLRWWIGRRQDAGAIGAQDVMRAHLRSAEFAAELPTIVERIKARRGGGRAIFLLDQYSYRAVPMTLLKWLMAELPGAEIILNFNVDSLTAFLSDNAGNRKPVRDIGLESYVPWEQLQRLKTNRDWRSTLQRHLAHGIKQETGAPFMTLFFVRPYRANGWSYWLVHLSQRYRAHDVMKQLHWEHSSEFGHELEPGLFTLGYNPRRDEAYNGQSSILFGPSSEELCVEHLADDLARKLAGTGPVTVGQLFETHISNTMADEARLQGVIQRLHRSREIVVSSAADRVRRPSKVYRSTDVIEYSPQIILT